MKKTPVKPPAPPSPPSVQDRAYLAFHEDILVELTPDRLRIPLAPEPTGLSEARLNVGYHTVDRPNGITVRLTSTDSRHRILRLSADSFDSRWRGRWVKWTYAVRLAPELMGGDALDAQDIVEPDGTMLKLLVAPGETRSATLELEPKLDGDTVTGEFPFFVVVEDLTETAPDGVPSTRHTALLRLEHQRSALLDQLPGIYREAMDEEIQMGAVSSDAMGGAVGGAAFFERFLLGFEDVIEPIMRTLAALDRLFGPYSTPPDYLVWLATWVCMPLDENWSEMKRRALISEAVELYRWRGTRRGLTRYLEIYTGVKPEIQDEAFVGMRLGDEALLGTDATILGDVPPNTFVVTIAHPEPEMLDERVIREIIRWEKPAHTAYSLNLVRREAASV